MKKILIAGFAFVLILGVSSAEAAFTMTVTPDRSGRDIRFEPIRFGRTARNEEVTFRVTTDEGVQYRITQNMMRPLTNGRGDTLPPDTITLFSASSVLGTLRRSQPAPLRMGQDVLYISDNAGTADNFTMAFSVNLRESASAGTYSTQIIYTLEPTSGGPAPVTVVRHIFLDVYSDSKFEIKNTRGGKALDLGDISRTTTEAQGVLRFDIVSNLGVPYRVYQEMIQPIMNESGLTLSESLIAMSPGTLEGQGQLTGSKELSRSRQLIYASDGMGSNASFEILYRTKDLREETAGIYRSTLNFSIESSSGSMPPKDIQIPVILDIQKIFFLDIEFENGQTLNFGQFTNEKTESVQHVYLKVHNNMKVQYQISQIASGPMTNDVGEKIPLQNYTYRISDSPRENGMVVSSTTPVQQGNSAIFISDSKGSPADLTIEYRLKVPVDQKGGVYSSDLTYSMSAV